jgi:ABC-type lipoprotein release transport system permease subunit
MNRFIAAVIAAVRRFVVVSTIAFRNLVRQFRRNLLLGVGIAVSLCILVVTSSFTNGLTDILFNKVMVNMTGHLSVHMDQYTTRRSDVIRDKERFEALIRRNVSGVVRIDETVNAFARAVGNGKTGFMALVGIPKGSDFYKDTDLAQGNIEDIYKPDVFPGIVMYKNAARDLNLKFGDTVTARFETVYGQSQAPKFKIVGLIPSENMFMDVAAFIDMDTMRKLLNLSPKEVLGLNIVTKYPEDQRQVIEQANKLYNALTPEAAGVKAALAAGGKEAKADVFALKLAGYDAGRAAAGQALSFVKGDLDSLAQAKDGVLLTAPLAAALGAGVGSRLHYSYTPISSNTPVEDELVVKGIVKPVSGMAEQAALANEELFYKSWFWNQPSEPAVAAHDGPLFKALLPEWDRLPRSATTDQATKKRLALGRENWKGAKLDVQTMFENASAIVDFQRGLNTLSLVAVLVLFFVILIGVVNTMRMSIRERTREIGTNRAIGMQRGDVRGVFVMEIVFLAIVACAVGLLLAWGVMAALHTITVELKDNPFSMFFVKKHLYFVPTIASIVSNFVIIVLVAFVIAFFSARRAANLRVADALRHFE